jgi:hypothetical protein
VPSWRTLARTLPSLRLSSLSPDRLTLPCLLALGAGHLRGRVRRMGPEENPVLPNTVPRVPQFRTTSADSGPAVPCREKMKPFSRMVLPAVRTDSFSGLAAVRETSHSPPPSSLRVASNRPPISTPAPARENCALSAFSPRLPAGTVRAAGYGSANATRFMENRTSRSLSPPLTSTTAPSARSTPRARRSHPDRVSEKSAVAPAGSAGSTSAAAATAAVPSSGTGRKSLNAPTRSASAVTVSDRSSRAGPRTPSMCTDWSRGASSATNATVSPGVTSALTGTDTARSMISQSRTALRSVSVSSGRAGTDAFFAVPSPLSDAGSMSSIGSRNRSPSHEQARCSPSSRTAWTRPSLSEAGV